MNHLLLAEAATTVVTKPDAAASAVTRPCAILLEDDPLDAELIRRRLADEGLEFDWRNTDSADTYRRALALGDFDLVISDFAIPGFDGGSALSMLRRRCKDVPFIFVSGTIGEERAVKALKSGATDYILKDNLDRLGPAVRRALAEREERVQRERAERRMDASEQRLNYLINASPAVIYTLISSGNHRCTFISDSLTSITGYATHAALSDGDFWTSRVHPDDLTRVIEEFRDQLAASDRGTLEYRFRHADGHFVWIHDNFKLITDPAGTTEVVGSWVDITETRALSEELSYQATHDMLTCLMNRREFERRLEQLVARSHIDAAEHVLCYIDLDQFKVVNDTCGHLAGDALLRQLTGEITRGGRKTDIYARLGGDEFAIIFQFCNVDQAMALALKIREVIAGHRLLWDGKLFQVSASLGLVAFGRDTVRAVDVLRMADEACFLAKDSGRDRIQVYDPSDGELEQRQREMHGVAFIHSALADNRLALYRQDIAPLQQDAPCGEHFEVLLRGFEANGDLVPPGAFLPSAERYGLSTRLDEWVLERTFRWLSERPANERPHTVSVNLSGHSLTKDQMLRHIARLAIQHPGTAEHVCLELTETAAVANLDAAQRFIAALREYGLRFALDDFGTGMSSFAYLKNLTVDYLKIDGIFVRNIVTDRVDCAMVEAITTVGHKIGLQVVAEFAESDDILTALRAIGVDYAQGYAIGKPRPLDSPIG